MDVVGTPGYHGGPMDSARADRRYLALGRAAELLSKGSDLDAVLEATFPVTRGYAARCARERRPLVIADARGDDDIRYDGDVEELRTIRSAVLAPLLVAGRLLGVISLDSTVPGAFDKSDASVLVVLAGLIGLAVDNVQLQRDVDRHVQERTAALSAANAEPSASQIEAYLRTRTEAEFTHGICPECARRLYPAQAAKLQLKG